MLTSQFVQGPQQCYSLTSNFDVHLIIQLVEESKREVQFYTLDPLMEGMGVLAGNQKLCLTEQLPGKQTGRRLFASLHRDQMDCTAHYRDHVHIDVFQIFRESLRTRRSFPNPIRMKKEI